MSTQFHARTTSPMATQGPTVQASKFTTTASTNAALAGKEGTPSEAVEELNIESAINDADHKMAKRSKTLPVATSTTRSHTAVDGRGNALNTRPANHADCSSPNSTQQNLRQKAHGKSTSQEAAIADGRAKQPRFEVSKDGKT